MIEKLAFYFQYPFVRYALIVGMLIALCSSLLGVTLVLKRFSFIGDSLSHVAFFGMTLATIAGLENNMLLALPITIACAIWLLCGSKGSGDSAVAMVSVGSLAAGYLLLNIFASSTNLSGDVCSTLFGSTSILTLDSSEVLMSVLLSIFVVVFFVLCYNRIFAATFDPAFTQATGTNAKLYNFLVAAVMAVVIVLAVNLVGSLLISALIIFPALSAMRLFKNYFKVTICAAVISVLCAGIGIIVSILAGTPVGSTIVAADAVVYGIVFVFGKLFRR